MTEPQWLTCADPGKMLEFLWRTGSHRKLRLFACACCYRTWDLLTGEAGKKAVGVAERYAEGLAGEEELHEATDNLEIVAPRGEPYPNGPAYFATWDHAPDAAKSAGWAADEMIRHALGEELAQKERLAQVASLHCIFGPLAFRSLALDPAWRTFTVTQLAEAIYQERAFDRLPILADALEEAGCTQRDILNHCRQPGVHVRGCFVVDLVVGKE